MLIRFNVKNFLSFSEREDGTSEEFSMIAGKSRRKEEHIYDDENIKLLKFAAIYGANAAGKSNLVKAMGFMKRIITNGLPKGHTNKYCRINTENKDKPSYFELEFMLNRKYYSYGFEVILSKSEFVSEWLIELTNNNEKNIFTRNIAEGKFEFGNELKEENLLEKLKLYAEDIQDDGSALLLSVLNTNKKTLYEKYKKASVFQNVYQWILEKLRIYYPGAPVSTYSYMLEEAETEKVKNILAALGMGISGLETMRVDLAEIWGRIPDVIREDIQLEVENKIKEMNKDGSVEYCSAIFRAQKDFFVLNVFSDGTIKGNVIKFAHGNNQTLFDLNEESDGTVRMLDLVEILLSDEDKIYVIDELDRCLHPSLTYKFVNTFLQLAKKRNIQLIVTTHESRLLDFDLLRRDEVWFIDKKASGESSIYSLEEYNTRFDKKIDKAYLEGRYGGVPVFNALFPLNAEEV